MRQLTLLVALALAVLSPARALGSWLAPPPVQWSVTTDGKFEVRRENRTGRVTIFDAGRKHALWSVEVAGVRELGSTLALVADGSLLVHVSGNHGVSALDEEVVVIYRRTGGALSIRAGQLITGLVVVLDRSSLSPEFRWLEKIERVTDGSLVLLNALRERKRIELSTGRVSEDREAAAPRARTVGVGQRGEQPVRSSRTRAAIGESYHLLFTPPQARSLRLGTVDCDWMEHGRDRKGGTAWGAGGHK